MSPEVDVATRRARIPEISAVSEHSPVPEPYPERFNQVPLDVQPDISLTLRRSSALVAADTLTFLLTLLLSVLLATFARWVLFGTVSFPVADDLTRIVTVFVPAYLILLGHSWVLGHYSQYRPFWSELQEVIKTVVILATFDAFILFVMGLQFSRLWFGFFLLLLVVLVPTGRELGKRWMIRRGIWYRRTYIVGTGHNAIRAAQALESDRSMGHKVHGFVDLDNSADLPTSISGKPVLQGLPAKERADAAAGHYSLVFAFESLEEQDRHQAMLNAYIASSMFVSVVPPPMGLPLYGATVVGIFRHDTAVIKLQNRLFDPKTRLLKRATDLVLGILILILLSPVFLVLWLLIRKDGESACFEHSRIGAGGRSFRCLKFRSMTVDGDAALARHLAAHPASASEWAATRKLRRDPRVTRIGRYLRKTSLDELPQLINVIRGEMSLVGPRPVVREELIHYGQYLPYYLSMTPGMTGLWQVSGRTDTSYSERVRLDVWYARNWSTWTDLVILIQTVKTLILRHGAY